MPKLSTTAPVGFSSEMPNSRVLPFALTSNFFAPFAAVPTLQPGAFASAAVATFTISAPSAVTVAVPPVGCAR